MAFRYIGWVFLAGLLTVAMPGSAQNAQGVSQAQEPERVHGFDVNALQRLARVSAPIVSRDGRHLAFLERQIDADMRQTRMRLWFGDLLRMDADPGLTPFPLTPADWDVDSPAFSDDGQALFFLSAKNGSRQLYTLPTSGGTPRQLTDFDIDIDTYRVSPDGRRIAFSAAVFQDCGISFKCTRQRMTEHDGRPYSGVLYSRLFVRHWDTWKDGRRNSLFVAALPDGDMAAITSVMAVSTMLDGDVPSKPFGDVDEYVWSPDGHALVASVRVAGVEEAWSTNFDLYLLDIDGRRAPVNLTVDNPAWDASPVFSADGATLYYRATRRPGFEADRFALMSRDMATGTRREIAPDWDRSVGRLAVSHDQRWLYVTAQNVGQQLLYRVDIATGQTEAVTPDGTVTDFDVGSERIVLTRNDLRTHDQVWVVTLDGEESVSVAVTPDTTSVLPTTALGDYEQFQFRGWNGELVFGYVVRPWNYQPGRRYPVAFLIHGGPQGSFGNSWSYRWNPQTYAGQGYAVVMIDFHGSTGYGQAFTDAISGHWGDRPLEDLQKGWRAAQEQFPFLDGGRACALGASYGGYMVNWIAGNWNEPWRCLVNHSGVFDTRSMGYVTEELWFTEWENGGTPYAVASDYERFNPINHVDQWRVPMLVIHGEKDYRVPIGQGLSAFTALQRRGIESQFLYFPDENHWILKPRNSVLWHDTVNAWLRRHLEP